VSIASRIKASLLAGALGDAWGSAYEHAAGPLIAPFPERPRLSDDTWLTMATCEAIARSGGRIQPVVIARTFVEWFSAGRLHGLGSSTLKALRDLQAGAHWALAGARGEFASGAGAAMRIAPLAFVLDPAVEADRVMIRDVARITHHSDEAYAGALAVAVAIRATAADGRLPDKLLSIVSAELPDTRVRDRLIEVSSQSETPEAVAARYGSSGHVVDVVPLALLVAEYERSSPLEHVVRRAVQLGGDTDTIASIAGQVAGASGRDVPAAVTSRIPRITEVGSIVDEFVAQVGRTAIRD
jgi:ADP-ribosylglycohydrolase